MMLALKGALTGSWVAVAVLQLSLAAVGFGAPVDVRPGSLRAADLDDSSTGAGHVHDPEFKFSRTVPAMGAFKLSCPTSGVPGYLAMGDSQSNDIRDVNSGYSFVVDDVKSSAILHLVLDPTNGLYKIQIEANRQETNRKCSMSVGWFLAVHEYYRSDALPTRDLRLIAHAVPTKAVLWDVVETAPNRYSLRAAKNLDAGGQRAVGQYLTMPCVDSSKPQRSVDVIPLCSATTFYGCNR